MTVDFERGNQAIERSFAQTVFTFTPAVGAPVAGLKGDLRQSPILLDDEGESIVATREWTLGVRLAQLPAGVKFAIEDTVTIDAVPWTIAKVSDNGEGHAWLQLHEAT